MSEVLDGVMWQLGSFVLGHEPWAALLTLSMLAVGAAKKIEWAARLSLLAVVGLWRAGAWAAKAMAPKPVHPAVKAALACCGPHSFWLPPKDGSGRCGFRAEGVDVTVIPESPANARVSLNGSDHSDLLTLRERVRIGNAALAEIARREKAANAAVEKKRLADRDALASLLSECKGEQGEACPCGPACECGPACNCDPCTGCANCAQPSPAPRARR